MGLGEGFPPAQELQVADVYEGTGDPVTPGSTLTVQYVGVGQQSGKVFDSSWPTGQPRRRSRWSRSSRAGARGCSA